MGSHTPPDATGDPVARFLAQHAARRERTVDDHMFRGTEQAPSPGAFRLQLSAAAVRPVVLAIQTIDDGPSLINQAEPYASAVWRCHLPDDAEPPLWIQRQLNEPGDDESPFQLVTFTVAGLHRLTRPRWHQLTAVQVEHLLGQPADGSRGDGYQPPPAVPKEIPIYEITPIADLPQPRLFREPHCMPGPNSWRRLLFWRTHPTRPTSCCWYHQQDWTRLSETVIALIKDAHRDGVTERDVVPYALARVRVAGPAADSHALRTLPTPSLAILRHQRLHQRPAPRSGHA
ncbi:hypothetical protein [Streptomyces sp. C1-2]|uniref:hypothetical protein n=1 Tax=Streptomyces sp. C1-2 TaxID=2720022 RepID=UPI001432700B|nr:hypothetical protein [Streptomyces sp. C1-2]NJP74982.1 hypothetical protein [Streptomyces sp. C1-2]